MARKKIEPSQLPFDEFVAWLEQDKESARVGEEVSENVEAASFMYHLDGKPLFFRQVGQSEFPVAANLFAKRSNIAAYLGCREGELIGKMAGAIRSPSKPEEAQSAGFMENEMSPADLSKLPILLHFPKDGGKYLSSAVVFAKDAEYGQNMSFHRMMVIGRDRLVARILPRHLDKFIERAGGTLDVAICIGLPPQVLISASTSVEIGVDEMHIANSLKPYKAFRLPGGILVPEEAQFVMEATITSELADEGPFVDLTDTYDVVRKQRVVRVNRIRYRNGAFYHALLPSGLEHKILMGMPREPTIYEKANEVCKCTGVNISPGGCSWLHAIVAIKKQSEEDGKKAIEAAFAGHKSLKHAIIVDDDIDIYNPAQVEWAIATRFQAKSGLVVKLDEKGSSLDPSADPITRDTSKMGIDATKPLVAKGKDFTRALMPMPDLSKAK
ncbi:MAG: UbiD family decarboxylase [Candidatus Micrarchaeia archaeon]